MRSPILNGFLQSDLDLNGFDIIGLATAPSSGGVVADVTQENASTPSDLATLWSTLASTNPTNIVFAPGDYSVSAALPPIPNCRIVGYGATITADPAMGVSNSPRWVFRSDSATQVDNCTIEGFLIDCNQAGQTAANSAIGGVYFYGSNNRVLNNKFINFGTASASVECFVCSLVSGGFTTPITASGNVVAGNEFTLPSTNAFVISIISCHGEDSQITDYVNPNATWNYGAKIYNNYIHDIPNTPGTAVIGINLGSYSVGQEVRNNLFREFATGSNTCIYQDTGASYEAVVSGNIALNVPVGINLTPLLGTGHVCNNLTIESNIIALRVGSPSYGIVTEGGPFPGATIKNNKVYRYSTSGTADIGFSLRYIQNGTIEGNFIGPNIGANYVGQGTNPLVRGNTFNFFTDEGNNTGLKTVNNRTTAGVRMVLTTDENVDLPAAGAVTWLNRGRLNVSADGAFAFTKWDGVSTIFSSANAQDVTLSQTGARVFVPSGGGFFVTGRGALQFLGDGDAQVIDWTSNIGAWRSKYERWGAGSPEGVVTAPIGSIYHRTDGGAGTAFYRKESGAGNTGWIADSALVAGGAGTVTTVSGVNANGFAWSIANPTTTPALTLAYTFPATYTRLIAGTTTVTGATPNLDWSLTTSFLQTLSANAVVTFSNVTDGWEVSYVTINTSGNYTVTFPTVDWGAAVTQPTANVGALATVWSFKRVGSITYGAVRK